MKLQLVLLMMVVPSAGCLTGLPEEQSTGSVVVQAEGFAFDFAEFSPEMYGQLVRIDAAGVPLVATSIMERDRGDAHHAPNSYTDAAPKAALSTLRVLKGAARLNRMWSDDFAALPHHDGSGRSYIGCDAPRDEQTELNEQTLPCQFQLVTWRDALRPVQVGGSATAQQQMGDDQAAHRPYFLGDRRGSRFAPSITAPERLLIKFDEPAGFPNGRLPWEQINDKVFAFGFLPLEANHMTLDQLHMNPYRNDVPFPVQADGRGAFPYLAAPHGTVHGGAGRPAY